MTTDNPVQTWQLPTTLAAAHRELWQLRDVLQRVRKTVEELPYSETPVTDADEIARQIQANIDYWNERYGSQ